MKERIIEWANKWGYKGVAPECIKELKDVLKDNETKSTNSAPFSRMRNPYPKDIFTWDNPEKLEFNRGRFNQHCYEVWENCRNEVLKIIDELRGMVAEDGLRRLQGEETKLAWSDAFDFLYGEIRVHKENASQKALSEKDWAKLEGRLKNGAIPKIGVLSKGCRELYDLNSKVCGIDGLCDECNKQSENVVNPDEFEVTKLDNGIEIKRVIDKDYSKDENKVTEKGNVK
jgi:hypothetical protein